MSATATNALFENYRLPVTKGRTSERGELLKYFCEKLNPGRVHSGFKPISPSRLAYRTRFMTSNRDLYWLKSECEDAERRGRSFSKRFWYYARQQKSANQTVASEVIPIQPDQALAENPMAAENGPNGERAKNI
jgi:hypothetical protein